MAQISAVWIGNPFFQSALADRASGDVSWRVRWINPPAKSLLGWNDIVAQAGFAPDVLIVGDKSQPPFVAGMERFPCLTVFYAVDTHIHSWFPLYGQAFDICLVSLKDHIPLFTGKRLPADRVWWSPPYAHPNDAPRPPDPEKPLWDVLFVGTADPAINPERLAFLEAVASLVPGLHVTRGAYADLYPQAKIVLNHTAADDLNFRVFEALGCGACLVTPTVRHGFGEIFRSGLDLFTFDQRDVPGLAALLRALLDDPERRRAAAAHGHATVRAGHYMRHRAEAFAGRVEALLASGKAGELVAGRRGDARQIHASWLRLLYLLHAEAAAGSAAGAAFLDAARA